jgi:hypothetical protein
MNFGIFTKVPGSNMGAGSPKAQKMYDQLSELGKNLNKEPK